MGALQSTHTQQFSLDGIILLVLTWDSETTNGKYINAKFVSLTLLRCMCHSFKTKKACKKPHSTTVQGQMII